MQGVNATLSGEELTKWEDLIRKESGKYTTYDPLQPIGSETSEVDQALSLIRRGVSIVPLAESLPLIPLYKAKGQELPAEIQVSHSHQRYAFVLASITFTLALNEGEEATYAEFAIDLEDGVEGPRASRVTQVFPAAVHTKWFSAGGSLSVGLNADLGFDVTAPLGSGGADISASGRASGSGHFLVGPLNVELAKTDLEVMGEGGRNIGWRFRSKGIFSKRNDYRSFLVLKVAEETTALALRARIGIKIQKRSWMPWLKEQLPILQAEALLPIELPQTA